jgi:multiple sugar transport system substrate-binding protein
MARLLAAALVLFALALTGCAERRGAAPVEVRFWAMGNEGENLQNLLPAFERLHPDIHVRVQVIPWTAAHEKLLTAYAGDATPDVCQLGNTWIPEFDILNALEPLDAWVARDTAIPRSSFFPGILATNIIDGHLLGIPWYVDTRCLYYRTDLFAAAGYDHPPRTWTEWYDVSKKLAAGGNYAILLPTNEWAPAAILGLQGGSGLLKDGNTRGDFSGKEFVASFRFYEGFFHERLAPVGVTQVTNIYQGIAEGFFAMYISGPWNIGEFRRRLPAGMQNRWMTAPMPGPDSSYPGTSLAGGASLVMFRRSANKEAAWTLIRFLSSPETQVAFYRLTGNLPGRREAWADTSFTRNPYVQAFYRQLQHVAPTPMVPEWERIAMKLQLYSEIASRREMTVEQAAAALDREVDILLEKRRAIAHGR